jgi:hypothetical protein
MCGLGFRDYAASIVEISDVSANIPVVICRVSDWARGLVALI